MSDICKGCGKPILWGKTEAGANIPLDNTKPIYRLERRIGQMKAVRVEDCYVSHFVTCPRANDFSRGKNHV